MMVYSCSEGEEPCKPTPTLTTKEAKDINDTSATLIGEVIAPTCDKTVTSQGFVYSETTLPKITDNVVEVSGVDISKQISDLKQNKTYYYRTFFTNPIGTFYGNEVTFKTQVGSAILNATSISNITAISATASSSVIGAGEGQITKRGVCWSTNQNPTTADNKTEDGTGIGQFSSELTNLKANTTYYLRTYAINEAGTTYGEEINFKTRDGVITLTTKQISNITIDSAMGGGNITDDGGAPVTMRGVCWSTNQNPTTADNKTEDGTGIGQFSSELKGLNSATKYYFRAYAINSKGTFYGDNVDYTTTTSISGGGVTFNGYSYSSIILGNGQEWMSENLRTANYANGDPIPNITNSFFWSRETNGAWAYYLNDSQYENPYGKLYNWYAVNDSRNLCPTGWKVPTFDDWMLFLKYLDPSFSNNKSDVAGGKMKSSGSQYWKAPNTGATNESGFSALPTNHRSTGGGFTSNVGMYGALWSSSEFNVSGYVRVIDLSYDSAVVQNALSGKGNGYSVRCIKN